MKHDRLDHDAALEAAARLAQQYRRSGAPLHPTQSAEDLRRAFCLTLDHAGAEPARVLSELAAAAEPGLVGNTDAGFHAWVMGASHIAGVAADWLTSAWGQNAAIYQTAPAAAIAEEAVASWILDLLDLPRESSVGFVTGATMAGFVGLAAARGEVLARAGHDFDRLGLQGAPLVRVFICEDTHVSNLAAVRYLGFGEANLVRIPATPQGLMRVDALEQAMKGSRGPMIVVAQAGHINSGGFDDFERLADLATRHDAWLHVDGAFGLWTRVLPEKTHLSTGIERADSWSVDGHKWLQLPYDSGFAIVRDSDAHRRAMDIAATYLTEDPEDGRNPTQFNPELSRRARGFAAWAVLRTLGRGGVRDMVRRHCALAQYVAERIEGIDGLGVRNRVDSNQVAIGCTRAIPVEARDALIEDLAIRLNATGEVFLRTTVWRGERVLRVSLISGPTDSASCDALVALVAETWKDLMSVRRIV
jgi:glutamate/tyrosine decarboxylase-like PLP-dependent enzyme